VVEVPEIAAQEASRSSAARRGLKIGLIFAIMPLAMFGAAYAAVPLYDLFCKVTGFGGTTQVATKAAAKVLDRTMEIRFDANVARNIPFAFKPEKETVTVKVGQNGLAFYRVTNTSSRPITAVATYNVTPHSAGVYFQKLECFCYQDTVLKPGETLELPVIFYVDPSIDDERQLDSIRTITLSYTFFEASDKRIAAAQAGKVPSL